jgi:hypothetical protein
VKTSIAALIAASVLLSLLARPSSTGIVLRDLSLEYSLSFQEGRIADARAMLTPETASGLSESFLDGLSGIPSPVSFRYDGMDHRGVRFTGFAGETGSRVLWFQRNGGWMVSADSAIDNLLGTAAALCRQNVMSGAFPGHCPVSGEEYIIDEEASLVICTRGHLGQGYSYSSDRCLLRRDSVASEVRTYLEAGYQYPAMLEGMYTISGGEYGRRGGYRCPDNGYMYYELRDGTVFCPFHEESSPVEPR